ncbi:AraC family transcriptional regulator [Dyella sp.]|uniref:AraC family transcriptional regulator n=1 Tax=Dyella sp. TaxID=1869338 RepID=UPI002ED379E1
MTQAIRHVMPATLSVDESDPRYLIADISPNVPVYLVERARRLGIDCNPWFAGLGFRRNQLDDPSLRISYRQARTLVRRAIASFNEPGLGLILGSEETVGSFGLLGLAMMTSRHFGDAMRVGIAHHRLCGSLLDVDFAVVDTSTVAVCAWPRFGETELLPFLSEELFSSSLSFARELVGPQLLPKGLELSYAAPPYAHDYARVFQCDVRFGCAHNRILVDTRWLDFPLPGYNPLTSRQSLALCTQQSRGHKANDEIVTSVERLLRSRLDEHPRLTEVAQSLHLSERSLRRRLAESGRIFREIHDRVRAERALELLQGGSLSVAEIGAQIGFSDPREFRRAFKRWTGMSPREAGRLRDP